MSNNLIKYIAVIGLVMLLFSCEKEEVKVYMLEDPISPTIVSVPDLTLQRSKKDDTLSFVATPVDPGFQASAKYYLEACLTGDNFTNTIAVMNSVKPDDLKITVGELNELMIKKLPVDQELSVDFRVRAVLVVDAGTGALGTSTNPLAYSSETKTLAVTLYGLPRLDLINSGIKQKIESAAGDGIYTGYVKLDASMPFTLKDPDTGFEYGFSGTTELVKNGTAVSATNGSGWYKLTAKIDSLKYELKPYMIGIIGSATPNGWSAPDQKMDYDYTTGLWVLTLDLIDGSIKFRMNDAWDQGINLGIGTGYSLSNLWNDGGSSDIPVTAGNYSITLSIGKKYKCVMTKNN